MVDFQKFKSDYKKALTSFEKALSDPVHSDRDKAGCIQFFEFSFELAWKLMKFLSEEEGLEVKSPKEALKSAYALNLINDEEVWLQMLQARNLMSHTYNESMALKVFDSLASFLKAMKDFLNKIA